MQLFSSDATMFFSHKNCPNVFFNNANRPKFSPNLNSCSIKISHRGTSLILYKDFGQNSFRFKVRLLLCLIEFWQLCNTAGTSIFFPSYIYAVFAKTRNMFEVLHIRKDLYYNSKLLAPVVNFLPLQQNLLKTLRNGAS